MTNTKLVFILLPLVVMACSLTVQSTVRDAMPLPEQTATASSTQALALAPLVCQVKTGIEAGALNLRTCGGIDCPIASILHEGETLTQTKQEPVNKWMEVITTSGLQGWANSKYLDCEVTK